MLSNEVGYPTCLVQMHRVGNVGAQCSEGVGWELGTCDYCGPDPAPMLEEPQKRDKTEARPPLPAGSGKTCKTGLAGLKLTGSFFFFLPKSKTVRPGAVRKPETNPVKEVRRKALTAQTNITLLSFKTCIFYISLLSI